jgi:hypothetical protein
MWVPFFPPGGTERRVFSYFGMRLFRYAKNRQDQGGPMSTVTAVALSMFLLAVTGKIDVRGEVMPIPMVGETCLHFSRCANVLSRSGLPR